MSIVFGEPSQEEDDSEHTTNEDPDIEDIAANEHPDIEKSAAEKFNPENSQNEEEKENNAVTK